MVVCFFCLDAETVIYTIEEVFFITLLVLAVDLLASVIRFPELDDIGTAVGVATAFGIALVAV